MSTFQDRHRSDFDWNNGGLGSFADILWRDHAGDTVLWLMNNNTPEIGGVATLPFVPPDWHVKAAADFDGFSGAGSTSGAADILWQNDNGGLALWRMEGEVVAAIQALPNPGPTWHVVGDNDFNNGFADGILFQNDNGALAIWTFAGEQISGTFTGTQNPGPTWH